MQKLNSLVKVIQINVYLLLITY